MMGKEQELRDALKLARAYVEQAVKDDGGIDNCEIGDRLALERVDAALALPSSDEQAEVAGGEAMLAAVGALSELEDAILACQTLNDLVGLQAATQRRREADLATFNRGIALAQARLSARDEPISPELQAAIDHTKAEIRAAFSGVTPPPAVAKGGGTDQMVEAALSAVMPNGSTFIDWIAIPNRADLEEFGIDSKNYVLDIVRAQQQRAHAELCVRLALTAALAVGDEGIREGERLAGLIEELADREKPGRAKLMLMIAARAVRRGRLLTPAEQLDNVERFLAAGEDADAVPSK